MKVIKSRVRLERHLNFQKKKKKSHKCRTKEEESSKFYAQNNSSVAKEEKLKKNKDKVKLFKKQIWERPYFICTTCHRCFYSRSVWLFFMVNYKDLKIDFVTKTIYDGKVYVCMTCHKSIKKKITPCHLKLSLIS